MSVTAIVGIFSLLAGLACGETTIMINGKTIRTSGSNIAVKNGRVTVDGEVLPVVEGSGETATVNRELGSFNELHLSINANVTITAGEKHECEITADDNLLPLILTEFSGNTLRISAKESFSPTGKVIIAVKTPLLSSAKLNGSGKIDIVEVTKEMLTLKISGSGKIAVKGKVSELTATINGSGDVHAALLEAQTATVTVNGSGQANVNVTDVFTGKVHGSGDITYFGSPVKVHSSVKGSGEIVKK